MNTAFFWVCGLIARVLRGFGRLVYRLTWAIERPLARRDLAAIKRKIESRN